MNRRVPLPLAIAGILLGIAAFGSIAVPTASAGNRMVEKEILRVADHWKYRVYLAVGDGGPSRVPVHQVLENPSTLFRQRRVGCAVFLGEGRLYLTTASVVENGTEVEIFDEAGNHVLARLIGRDEPLDLALVEAVDDLPETASLGPLEIADRASAGSTCMILGNAYGQELSATLGRVGRTEEIVSKGVPLRAIRVHAPIFPGDSGAPIIDDTGRFLGVMTAVVHEGTENDAVLEGAIGEVEIAGRHAKPAGLQGFAVPARQAQMAWHDLRDFGRVRRAYLGVRMALTEGGDTAGAQVLAVVPDSPAEAMGIRPGDLVIGFGERQVTSPRQFCALVAETPPSSRLELRILRGNEEVFVSVVMGEASRPPGLQTLEDAASLARWR